MDTGYIKKQSMNDTIVIGELSLDGKLNKVKGVLPIAIEAMKLGIKRLILPKENAKEAAIMQNIDIIGVSDLKQLVEYLNGSRTIEIATDKVEITQNYNEEYVDFSDIKGQENAKRALEIATARWAQLFTNSVNPDVAKRFYQKESLVFYQI